MSIKKLSSYLLRKTGLLEYADYVKFAVSSVNFRKKNNIFRKENPCVKLPPDFMLFESFGKLDYHAYYFKGKESAADLFALIEKYHSMGEWKVLEWGCGPCRILRHLPEMYESSKFYGSDYNPDTINWCKKNIPEINFSLNKLNPPFEFSSETFDIVYAVSVFTHLDAETQTGWFEECVRILKTGGIFLFTIHGDSATDRLFDHEKAIYKKNGIYIRANVTEGKRSFTSYNSESYIKKYFSKNILIMNFIPGKMNEQDIWIVKKID